MIEMGRRGSLGAEASRVCLGKPWSHRTSAGSLSRSKGNPSSQTMLMVPLLRQDMTIFGSTQTPELASYFPSFVLTCTKPSAAGLMPIVKAAQVVLSEMV